MQSSFQSGRGAAPSAGEHYACVLLQNVGAGAGSGTRPVSRLGILCTGLVWIPTTASYSCPTQGRRNGRVHRCSDSRRSRPARGESLSVAVMLIVCLCSCTDSDINNCLFARCRGGENELLGEFRPKYLMCRRVLNPLVLIL